MLSNGYRFCPIVVELLSISQFVIQSLSNCSPVDVELCQSVSNCLELLSKLSLYVVESSNCGRNFVEMLSKFWRIAVEVSIGCWVVIEFFLNWCQNFLVFLLKYWFAVDLLSNFSRVDVEILSICSGTVKFLSVICWIVQTIFNYSNNIT